jgi:hypothetical protein
MKSIVMSIMLIGILTLASAFSPRQSHIPTSATQLLMRSSRREFVNAIATFGIVTGCATPAHSKMPKETLTEENFKAAWDDLKFELHDPKGGVSIMQSRIDDQDFVGLMEFTKGYDLDVRKLKIGRCKAYLSSVEQAVATMSANAITFDLIGINRSARLGKENQSECYRYLNELRTDLQAVIDQERTVNMEAVLLEQANNK